MPRTARCGWSSTRPPTTSWRGSPTRCIAAHERGPWKEIGVLTRDNASAALVFDALTDREIPVEIVGLKGLLRLPEVAEVVATLELVQDVTANPALLTLLAGPRWAIGPRDLALLGTRSGALAGQQGQQSFADVETQLAAAVEGADPLEIPSLCDALEDPGDLDYSPEARERFALLADELRVLRRSIGEPILDLVRRIIDVNGIDVELASSVSPAAAARRENLDLFVQAVADFQAIDGQVTLPALLAWLDAEDEFGQGLDVATPSEADSVKLLTVHRAKGLEWDAVFLVGVVKDKFPANRGRSSWLKSPEVMPAALRGDARDLPQLAGHGYDDIAGPQGASQAPRAGRGAAAGLRRVDPCPASPRGVVLALGTAPEVRARPFAVRRRHPRRDRVVGRIARAVGRRRREGRAQPLRRARRSTCRGRCPTTPRRSTAGSPRPTCSAPPRTRCSTTCCCSSRSSSGTTRSPGCSRRRPASGRPRPRSPMPTSISATALARLRDDPEGFAADRARPMPRQPSSAARFGTRFHAWVEARFGQQELFDPDDLPGRADAGIEDDEELKEVIAAFEAGPFATRPPHHVEAPFALVLAGQVVRGRIDAVYDEGDPRQAGARSSSWTGRPTPARPPTRSSSRSTGWPGPSCTACRSSRSGLRSTTSARASWSSRTGCRIGPSSSGWSRPQASWIVRAGVASVWPTTQ